MAKTVAMDLPYNAEAEKAVLGSALLSRDALFTVLSELKEEDFFETRNRIIFRILGVLQKKNIIVDVLTMTEELINIKELENVGGVDYLKVCTDAMVALSSLQFYINIVRDQAVLRELLLTIRDIDKSYRNEQIEDVDEFIKNAEVKIKNATEKRRISTFRTSQEVANVVEMAIAEQLKSSNDNITGLTTGFDNLDKITQGFQKGEMIIVAARPSVGKTALAMNFAYRAALKKNVPVAIFSLEMSAELLIKRLLAADSNVSLTKINSGDLNALERNKISHSVKNLGAAPIYIDDSPGIHLMNIIAKSRQLQAKHPDLGLIIVDYLGLVTTGNSSSKGNDSRQEEVRKISLALKALARDLKVPVIVVSQLSRDVEKRDTKKPMMSDLRDSGSIEQDADVVMLLYREDYYKSTKKENGDKKKAKDMTKGERFELIKQTLGDAANLGDASYVEVNVAKNRNGQTGPISLFFYKSFGRFDQPSQEFEEQMRNFSDGGVED
jgi:replicative DNA helicase